MSAFNRGKAAGTTFGESICLDYASGNPDACCDWVFDTAVDTARDVETGDDVSRFATAFRGAAFDVLQARRLGALDGANAARRGGYSVDSMWRGRDARGYFDLDSPAAVSYRCEFYAAFDNVLAMS